MLGAQCNSAVAAHVTRGAAPGDAEAIDWLHRAARETLERPESPNYVGTDAIESARDVFSAEGFVLTEAGELYATLLDNLSGTEMTEALKRYVRRAQRG